MALEPSDMVSWERPLGVVHLTQSGKRQLVLKPTSTSEQPYFCTIEGPHIRRSPNSIGAPLVRSRRSITSESSFI